MSNGPIHFRHAPASLRRSALALSLALVSALTVSPARAQAPVEPERLPAFGRSVAGTDDTTALLQNPANLAFLPGPEFRWESVFLHDRLSAPYNGHAVSLGFKLPFGLGSGIRLDLIDPPGGSFGGQLAQNYQWLTWGFAAAPTEAFSIGGTIQHAYSHGPVADGLGSFTLATSVRPSNIFGVSVVLHHVNGPMSHAKSAELAALGAPGIALGPSVTTAIAVRPFETRAVELGLEARALLDQQIWQPRATLGIAVPWVGRLRGEFMVTDVEQDRPDFRATASLSVYLNAPAGSTELEGGGVTGTALGQRNDYNFFGGFAVRGFREGTGVPPGQNAVRIRLEDTPDHREHVALLRKLWELAASSDVAAVVFELRDAPADSVAHVQELRDAVALLRANGKRVLCHLEDATGTALYFCAAADRILINPAGDLRFAGLRARHFYIANLLDNVGIKADFVRAGAHKSAPEQFTRNSASDVARADTEDLLQQNELWLIGDIAHDRKIPVEILRERIAHGPFTANEARAAGLVDGTAFDDQIEDAVSALAGKSLSLIDLDRAPVASEYLGRRRSIALMYIDGDIIDGRSKKIPLVDVDLVGSYSIAETLRRIRESPLISAVVLRIESPGGSSMASDVMWREVALTAKVKPVVVSMGGLAASGGYYVAAPATRIYANPLSITGSIGVFYGKADVSGLMRKIGVNVQTYTTAPRADAESMFRPFTDSERAELSQKVDQFYDVFLSRVSEGRRLSKVAVDQVGQGRVWTGEQAKARGLVDELGGLRQALADARRRGGLPDDAPIIELPKVRVSLIERILGLTGAHSEASSPILPSSLMSTARAMAPFLVHPSDRPLSRIEITAVEP